MLPAKARARRSSRPDPYRGRAAIDLAVIHRLDVVAVGIEDESRVVAGVVVALARGAVVPASVGHRGAVEGVDHRPVLRLERDVVAPGELALHLLAVARSDVELVGPEVALVRASDRNLQDLEDG